jgi:multidrug efflux pump subunit AcrA (membrane-fusion protein)
VSSFWRSVARLYDGVFESVSIRPLGLLVFAGSVVALVWLQTGVYSTFRAEAVAQAQHLVQPAQVDSFILTAFVSAGDTVEKGAPLVELSPHFIDRELERVDARIERLLHEAQLAQAQLVVREERWVDPALRSRPREPSLQRPTEALYAAELAEQQARRDQLAADRESLIVKATHAGRVVEVLPVGSAVGAGSSVAAITPEYANEIVAYVPADTSPLTIASGAPVVLTRAEPGCEGAAEVIRRGAEVEKAPGQLRWFVRAPLHGMPVYISIPPSCRLGVGQVLTVEFPRAVL